MNSEWAEFQQYKKEQSQPEELKEVTTQHQLGNPTTGKIHDWKQMGPEIVCFSCESQHSFRIGMNKRLKGFNEQGHLIIETI